MSLWKLLPIGRKEFYMDMPLVCAILSGMLFTVWPFFLNKSGIEGSASSVVFSFTSFFLIALVTVFWIRPEFNPKQISLASVSWIILAGFLGGLGVVIFNRGTMSAKITEIGKLSAVMIVTQAIFGAVIHACINRDLSAREAIGFLCAVASVYLLHS